MFYGFVGGTIRTVFNDYKKIERLAIIYPYCSYRKFYDEADAWRWVGTHGSRKITSNIYKYGKTFDKHFVTFEYKIANASVYANITTKNLGYVKLLSDDNNVVIDNRTGSIYLEIKDLDLNPDLVLSHLIAIYNVLDLLGNFVDVEVVLPNHSIFFALTKYTGNSRALLRVIEKIKKRKGGLAWTLKDYVTEDKRGDANWKC